MNSLLVILSAAILFMLVLISLAFQPRVSAKITGWLFFAVAAAGFIIYGYAFSILYLSPMHAVVRTVFSVFCMFLGRNEISAVSAVPAYQTPVMQILIYLAHLGALYVTASAVITGLGRRLLRLVNLLLVNRKNISLIYGVSDDTLSLASELQDSGTVVIFADDHYSADKEAQILNMGSLLFSGDAVSHPGKGFLKQIGAARRNRHLHIYCMQEGSDQNKMYAEAMRDALEDAGVPEERTSLTMITADQHTTELLQADPAKNRYGYGSVYALNRVEFIARLMMRRYPPYQTMTFDGHGKALENFEGVIIGFGSVGQAVLRSLLMNAQFEGSRFHAAVVDDKYDSAAGNFFYEYPGIGASYNIEFRKENGRGIPFYRYLSGISETLNYIAVCTGSEKENAEIAAELTEFISRTGSKAVVVQGTVNGIRHIDPKTGITETSTLYSAELLNNENIDHMAMVQNHQYNSGNGRTMEENWKACDYFSRMSCRAGTDFIDALLYTCGADREDVLNGRWHPSEQEMENLGRTEHLRWCAFHAAMGYRTMPEEVLRQRAAERQREIKETGSSRIRIAKDTRSRQHACLVDWDELDHLSKLEEELTGVHRDYKAADFDNIRMIPEMLKR